MTCMLKKVLFYIIIMLRNKKQQHFIEFLYNLTYEESQKQDIGNLFYIY